MCWQPSLPSGGDQDDSTLLRSGRFVGNDPYVFGASITVSPVLPGVSVHRCMTSDLLSMLFPFMNFE